MAHLWTGGPAPWEQLELSLCRDVYHCTPAELAQIPLPKLLKHMIVLGVEGEVAAAKRTATASRKK